MKFSVLLPTRNRLDLLKYAVESVLRQDWSDWEIIISDNHSEQDIAGYVRGLNDGRIRYYRTDTFIPVTDNWNNAFEKSSGEYFIMLGDDDCLMRNYFSSVHALIEKFDSPDFIYQSAFLYAYPGVMPDFPQGFLEPYGYADFLQASKEPYWLDRKKALALVRHSMNFRVLFSYNMQFTITKRTFADSLKDKGNFFQSPYPDYYATNVMLLKAGRILVFPKPMVTIGISPKSFGFYFFNDAEQTGTNFLNNIPVPELRERLQNVVLPGSPNNTSWLCSMETIKANFGREYNLKVNYCRYRFMQSLYLYEKQTSGNNNSSNQLLEWWSLLSLPEKISYGFPFKIISLFPRSWQKKALKRLNASLGTHPHYKVTRINGSFLTIVDVFTKIDPLADANFKFKKSRSHFFKKNIVKQLEFLFENICAKSSTKND